MRRIERALLSVYDKTGVLEFARGLSALKVEIVSTGGTSQLLRSNGIAVRDVSELTGFPEILDGRVKTIHPLIAAGLLAVRNNPKHAGQVKENRVPLIDLVCVNLYPFAETIRKPGVHFEEVIENIDIGGPSMLRAAAKNFQDVAVVTSPSDYERVLAELQAGNGALPARTLFDLARRAFVCTARYDAQISQYLSACETSDAGIATPSAAGFPPNIFMDFEKVSDLRYGENPHQRASFYRWGGQAPHGLAAATQIQGKELSYNNLVDLEAAWALIEEFERPACCIIKHTNPCGAAVGSELREAYLKAYEADTVSAFGSIIAFNRVMDAATATEVAKLFVEAMVAPGYDSGALEILRAKKNLRVLAVDAARKGTGWAPFEIRKIQGGILVQDADSILIQGELKTVTKRVPTPDELVDLDFAWRVAKHVKSNAIVLAQSGRTVGVGAGQMSRVDSVKLSIQKAYPTSRDAVLASDAYFPFRDGIDEAARGGVRAIIQPGGSVRDPEVIAAANEHGLAMVFAGNRHFRH